MASARRLYRFGLALAGVGVAVTVLALAAAASALEVQPPSVAALIDACRGVLPAEAGAGGLLVLALGLLTVAVVCLAARSLIRQLREGRRLVRSLAVVERRPVDGVPVLVTGAARVEAFCGGYLAPRIYVSRGAVERLADRELAAVVAHERHHQLRRDPLRLLTARVLRDGLFFLPALRGVAERYAALAEIAADEAAVRATSRTTLASALLAVGESHRPGTVVGIAPERVEHLLGHDPRWELPLPLLAAAAAAVGAILAMSIATAVLVGGATLGLPALLAQGCMVAMAALPAVAALLAVHATRPLLTARMAR